jgi:pimeloyl-ACP methyl ester carboxylesterase
VLDPMPNPRWLNDQAKWRQERKSQESPLPSRVLLAASSVPGWLAWLEQGEEEVELWLSPQSDSNSARKIASVPLVKGFYNLTLSPDGGSCLVLRQDPEISNPREQAVLDLYNLEDGSHSEISRSAAVLFDPSWTDEETFLFAEATTDFSRVLEQRLDGTRSQAFAMEARYPRLTISPLYPQGWVVYDRTRPLDTHCWVRTTTSQGPSWAEVFLAHQEVRLLGWRQDRPIVIVRDSRTSSRFLALSTRSLDLQTGKLQLKGEEIARVGVADFVIMKKDRVAFLQVGIWGHSLRMLDLDTKASTDVSFPCDPGQGRKFRSAGPEQAIFVYEGPFQPASVALLELGPKRLSRIKVNNLTGLNENDLTIEVGKERVWLAPRKAVEPSPILVESYGAFRQTILPTFDWVRAEWLRRGGRVLIEQIDVEPRGFEQARDELLKRTEALGPSPLVLRGQSTGATLGLLAMLANPERFVAVWADAPVTDLVNFDKLLPGDLWVNEFGDPKNPKDLERLKSLSPLANLRKGPLPRLLLSTASDDVAVDPRHTTRFLQRARELNPKGDFFLLWERNGIHGRLKPLPSDLLAAIDLLWEGATKPVYGQTRVKDRTAETR